MNSLNIGIGSEDFDFYPTPNQLCDVIEYFKMKRYILPIKDNYLIERVDMPNLEIPKYIDVDGIICKIPGDEKLMRKDFGMDPNNVRKEAYRIDLKNGKITTRKPYNRCYNIDDLLLYLRNLKDLEYIDQFDDYEIGLSTSPKWQSIFYWNKVNIKIPEKFWCAGKYISLTLDYWKRFEKMENLYKATSIPIEKHIISQFIIYFCLGEMKDLGWDHHSIDHERYANRLKDSEITYFMKYKKKISGMFQYQKQEQSNSLLFQDYLIELENDPYLSEIITDLSQILKTKMSLFYEWV